MKVYIVGNGFHAYERMFKKKGHTIVDKIREADLVQFTGGSDVDPLLYGQMEHPRTSCNIVRDKQEVREYALAKSLGKRIAGICRGGQLLCVMAGHELWQDVSNHAVHEGHMIVDKFTNVPVHVTSTHHQMMKLNNKGSKAIIIATAGHVAKRKSTVGEDGWVHDHVMKEEMGEDLEVIYFPDEKSLAFQPHPEFGRGPCMAYYFELLDQYLGFK